MRDTLYSDTLARVALTAEVRSANAAANGETVDLGVFGNDFRTAKFVFLAGTITDGTHTVKLQDSPNGSDWTDVTADRLQGTAPVLDDGDSDSVAEIGYIVGTQQYVRCVVTTAGATSGGLIGAVAELSESSVNPVARS